MPKVVVIYGLLARQYVQRQLLHFLQAAGYRDALLLGHRASVRRIADQLEIAARDGRSVVLVGYSQGGFHAVRISRELQRRSVAVGLLVTIAAGGMGRWLPAQWGFNPRRVPGNVRRCLNYFALGDRLGSDRKTARNLAHAAGTDTLVENIAFDLRHPVTHTDIVRCYPPARVHPAVSDQLLDRLMLELAALAQLPAR